MVLKCSTAKMPPLTQTVAVSLLAVPPIAAPYGLRSLLDESLAKQSDIYFEAGDHRTLVHVSGEQFNKLMHKVPHGRICGETGLGEDEYVQGGA